MTHVTHVNHHTYVVPGVVDGSVAALQAERRRDQKNETTIVHAHKFDHGCNNKCKVYEPGYRTRSVATERVPIEIDEEEKY